LIDFDEKEHFVLLFLFQFPVMTSNFGLLVRPLYGSMCWGRSILGQNHLEGLAVRNLALVTGILTILSSSVLADTATPPSVQSPAPVLNCPAAEYDQFNFMIGEWVAGPSNGTSRDDRSRWDALANGCAILENWTAKGGNKGYSFNYYDLSDKKWHQNWIGANGDAVHFIGDWNGKMMAFRAEDVSSPQMQNVVLTMTFEPLPDGSVRQTGKTSSDGGKTFQFSYQLIYQRPAK
jgi:hypothetical protein